MRAAALAIVLLSAACQVPAPEAPMTPEGAAASTFMVDSDVGKGTAWVVSSSKDMTYLVTAGHVCDMRLTALAYGLSPDFRLVAQDGKQYPATFLHRDPIADLCLVTAPGYLGPALRVAAADAEYGTPVAYVGAPQGYFGEGVAPFYRGYAVGAGYMAIATAPGASGSAIFSSSGVVGVLVTVARGFDSVVGTEPRATLVKFLADAGL